MSQPSKNKTIHVATGQISCVPGDVKGNFKKVTRMTRQAAEAGAKIILFAETTLTGHVFTDKILKTAIRADGPEIKKLLKLSAECGLAVAVGAIEKNGDLFHNTHFVAFPKGKLLSVRKHKGLERKITGGPEQRQVFTVGGVKMAVNICADLQIPDIKNKLARLGCQVYLCPVGGSLPRNRIMTYAKLKNPKLRAQYLEDLQNVCFPKRGPLDWFDRRMALVAVNLMGDNKHNGIHPGHSMIIDSYGCLAALHPGQYLLAAQREVMLHAKIAVQNPKVLLVK